MLCSLFTLFSCNRINEESPLTIDTTYTIFKNVTTVVNDSLIQLDTSAMRDSINAWNKLLIPNKQISTTIPNISDFDTVQIKGKVYYLAEGDILLSEQELINRLYFEKLLGPIWTPEKKDQQKAVVLRDTKTGEIIKWKKFPLTFAIDQNSFSAIPNGYTKVRSAILKSVQDWQSACGVKIVYHEHLDNKPGIQAGNEVDFVVLYSPINKSETIATSFFPTDSIDKRAIRIYHLYWTTSYELCLNPNKS